MLFIDSADPVAIREILDLGIARGVTTNPLFLPRTPDITQNFTLRDILRVAANFGPWCPVCVQLTSVGAAEMLKEARDLRAIFPDDALVFKVPFSQEGLWVTRQLSSDGLQINVTSLMSTQQAYLAIQAGAHYVSLFCGRIADAGGAPAAVVSDTRKLLDAGCYVTKIIAGSIRQASDVTSALLNGAHIVTAKPELLKKMMQHPMTEQVNEEFRAAAEKNNSLYPKDP